MPRLRTIIVSLLPAVLLAHGPVAAVDQTPQPFPTVEQSSPKSKSRDEPTQKLPSEVRWTVTVPALPAARPSVSESHVFVPLKSGSVAAFAIADGTEVWTRELRTEWPIEVADDRVFVASSGAIHALAAADGTTVWTVPADAVTAPLLAQDGWVIAAIQGHLAAYRAHDGTEVWRQSTGQQLVRATIEGDRLYAPLTDRLLSLELATGKTGWTLQLRAEPTEVLAFPDRIYLGSLDKYFYCVKAVEGVTDWKKSVGAVLGRPAADATQVYIAVVDNLVRAFDRRSGAQRWQKDARFRPTSGPVVVGAAVVVAGSTAQLSAFNAKGGATAGQLALAQSLLIPPAFGSSKGEILMAALTGDLTEQWNLTLTGPPLWTSPAVEPLTALPGVVVPIGTTGR